MIDTDRLRECARRAAACAGRLRLPMRMRVWRGAAGELVGAGTGSSMDFQDHRPYFPGDDPRHINWQAYARTDQLTMKLYREEVRPTIDVLLDASPSMFLTPAKAERTAELFHFAVECALRAAAGLTVHVWRGPKATLLPVASVLGLRWPDDPPAAAPGPPRLPEAGALALRSNGLRVLVSDLLFPGNPADPLRPMTHGHGSAVVLAPFAPEEADPDWSGPCEFDDVESGHRESRLIDGGVLARYRRAYEAHFQTWKDAARRFRVPIAPVPTGPPLEAALSESALRAGALEPGA